MNQAPPPGWYKNPQGSGRRWWDGTVWTEHVEGAATPAMGDQKTWAMAAHLSALLSLVIGFTFVGPLIVYLIKRDDDPFIRRQAAEALNFNISVAIYAVGLTIVLLIGLLLIVGVLLFPLYILGAIAWFVLTVSAAVKAGRGEPYRYPLTIRFVD